MPSLPIQLRFLQTVCDCPLALDEATASPHVCPRNETGHPAHYYKRLMQVPLLESPRNINWLDFVLLLVVQQVEHI